MALGGSFSGGDHLFEPLYVVLKRDVVGPFKGPLVEMAPHHIPDVGAIEGLTNELV